jgi:hypothetical protein
VQQNGNGHKRTDDLTLKLPWGASVQVSGTLAVLVLLMGIGFGLLFYVVDHHSRAAATQQKENAAALDDLLCVLTLTSEERIEARRGVSLNRWCLFLDTRTKGGVRK